MTRKNWAASTKAAEHYGAAAQLAAELYEYARRMRHDSDILEGTADWAIAGSAGHMREVLHELCTHLGLATTKKDV